MLWTDVSQPHHDDISRSTGGGPYELIQQGHQTAYCTYLDTQVENGNQYCYQIRWVDDAGALSLRSNEACATPQGRRGGGSFV